MKMPTGSARAPPNSSSSTRSINPNGPVMVEHNNMKFLITDRPTNATLPQFIEVRAVQFGNVGFIWLSHLKLVNFLIMQELKKYKAHVVVRVCEPTYNTEALAKEGITVVVSFYGSICVISCCALNFQYGGGATFNACFGSASVDHRNEMSDFLYT